MLRVEELALRVKQLEKELEEARLRIVELELQLSKKKQMPRGGNVHKVIQEAITIGEGRNTEQISSIYFNRLFKVSLKSFNVLVETRVNKSGKVYKDWKKAMEFARNDVYIKAYARETGVQITQRNLVRWYKFYITEEIALNKSIYKPVKRQGEEDGNKKKMKK